MAEKKYWKGLEELHPTPEFIELSQQEFGETLPVEMLGDGDSTNQATRRDFLKVLGFSVTAAAIAGCEMPVNRVAPYIFKPEEVIPGIATWYASSYINGSDYCSILVKTREGRPIKIEGNRDSMITKGGTSAKVQASVLSLYDTSRLTGPMTRSAKGAFEAAEWAVVDAAIVGKLKEKENAAVRILTSSIISPSTKKVMDSFTAAYPNTKVYTYDALSLSGMLEANMQSLGQSMIPHYHFEKAKVVVGFECDFLGGWVSPIEHTKGYVAQRKVSKSNPDMSRHYQFESRMSLAGSNADYRVPLKPSDVYIALVNLYDAITGSNASAGKKIADEKKAAKIKDAAKSLMEHQGQSLVVCGINDVNVQLMVNAINLALGNYGATIDTTMPSMMHSGIDSNLKDFIADINNGNADVVMINGCNPAYDSTMASQVAEALKKAPVSISFAGNMDETSQLCQYICPDHHYL